MEPSTARERHSAPPNIENWRNPLSQVTANYSEKLTLNQPPTIQMNSNCRIFVKRSHTVTTLCTATVGIILFEYLNRTRFHFNEILCGLLASVFMFLTFAVCCFPDGAFVRPSPPFWRIVLGATILYLMFVVFAIFQDISSIRSWLVILDSTLDTPPLEKSYAENCALFDSSHPKGILGPIIDSIDFFVFAHAAGWAVKFMILRDWTICWVLSFGFELCELTFRFILPNFWECWWDHLLLDLFGMNLLGMVIGCVMNNLVKAKKYDNWRCVDSIQDASVPKAGVKAAFWSVETWSAWLFIIYCTLAFDVNYFFVKAILWLEPSHWLVFVRAIPLCLAACHSTRQAYDYMNNPSRSSIGIQLWIFIAILLVEIVFIVKNFKEIVRLQPSHEIEEQPLYSKCIVAFFASVTIIGYIVAYFNQHRRSMKIKAT